MSRFVQRQWMYQRLVNPSTNEVSSQFFDGLNEFLTFAQNQQSFILQQTMLCPCARCKNKKRNNVNNVGKHLYSKGFMPNYYIWTSHGEIFDIGGSSNMVPTTFDLPYQNVDPVVEMVYDAFPGDNTAQEGNDQYYNRVEEESLQQVESPRGNAHNFYNLLESANQPLYEGCVEGISSLMLASEMMNIKTSLNLSEAGMDLISKMVDKVLPPNHTAPKSYYETKKLTRALGLPYHKIDVCENNCMLFWKIDANLISCRFCNTERYRSKEGKGKKVAKQRMFYLPISDRLKRLYQSKKTAKHMRWHAEHSSPEGEMHHPSDAGAWKTFQQVYPNFASESRNVYLGLSTDGFNPLGMQSHNHSVWPVIVTPYNLPPEMCMKREYLFLSILVPGPNHPKKSLDIFLQPLIEELRDLWDNGVDAYDVSQRQNFRMHVALMWTISDFPAYGMLSGWTTHGRLACPYCQEDTLSFWLQHGRKHSWFDCHRIFLNSDHPYRRNKTAFYKNVTFDRDQRAPGYLNGEEVFHERIMNIEGLNKTSEVGGHHDSRTIEGYGIFHNWIKKSIFWDLPYWKDQPLRHNLDVMHIEKNFFDNIMNTVLNVTGKTKDNLKSRLDLPEICKRRDLEIKSSGAIPVPIFRLSKEGRSKFLNWLKTDIKFPDGYVSNISKCVDEEGGKLSGLKSHDCHVIMQRLLPIAFSELLPKNVHTAISEIALFFRDICARTLKIEDVQQMKENIALKICNLEKIFPPSFFDVMEHLPVHLPYEAELGGPVQFRWMYPFERFMHHLKKKVKNKAQIGGSIVAQSVNEEISHFTTYYFGSSSTNERPSNEFMFQDYAYDIPSLFQPIGRTSGKSSEGWLDEAEAHLIQTYLLLNCEEIVPYERLFEEYVCAIQPNITDEDLFAAKEQNFAKWCKEYVTDESVDQFHPLWLIEFVQGPKWRYESWPMYFSRGYTFHTEQHGKHKRNMNYGVCVRGGGQSDFYGLLEEIFMIEYHGAIHLRTMLFRCVWFDPTDRGVRKHDNGIVDVNFKRRYSKNEPFILPEQADQVCYIPYPQVRKTGAGEWRACTKVIARGTREDSEVTTSALQDNDDRRVVTMSDILEVNQHAIPSQIDDELDNPPDRDEGSDDQFIVEGDVDSDSDDN